MARRQHLVLVYKYFSPVLRVCVLETETGVFCTVEVIQKHIEIQGICTVSSTVLNDVSTMWYAFEEESWAWN